MSLFFRKYFWTLNLVTIALCALLAAKSLGRLVEANLPQAQSRRVSAASGILDHTSVTPHSRDIKQILARNIFCSSCEQVIDTTDPSRQNKSQEPANNAPVKTSLPLKLIATLVSTEDKAWSFAAVEETSQEKTGLFAIGSSVPGGATITDIMDRRILLLNSGRNEFLDLDAGDQPAESDNARPAPKVSLAPSTDLPGMDAISKGIRKVAEGKYEIQRSALNKVLGNTTLLARSARIVPSVRDGKPNGFKLYAIRPGSLYSLLGMYNGDTINAINGHPITTPDKALEVYTKLRNASHVSISFTRRGSTSTHEYTIR